MSSSGSSHVHDVGVQTSTPAASADSANNTPAPTSSSNNSLSGSSGTSASTSTVATTSSSSSVQTTSSALEDLVCRWTGCTERFTSAENLYDHICERHVGRKSTNNLNLTCQWNACRTTTVKRDHITSHVRVHVPLKPHKCDFCKKSFKRPQDLKKHVKTHADDSVLVVPGGDRMSHTSRGVLGNPASSSYHYDHTGAIRTNHALSQPHQNGQANNYHYHQSSSYGAPMYYHPTATQTRADMFTSATTTGAPTSSFDSRKRSYEAVNDFFHSVKRREVDPGSYTQVSRALMPLHNSLPIHAQSVGNDYMTAAAVTAGPLPALTAAPSLGSGVATAGPAQSLTQYYSLPRSSDIRTKNDLLQVDRMLEQMQGSVYESDPAAMTAQAVSAYTQNQVHIRQSQSPPHIHAQPQMMSAGVAHTPAMYPHVSAAHMGSPMSAISPIHSTGSPVVSPPYTSAHSPGASSAGFSPASRHSSTSSIMYPSLPMAPSGNNITPTLGTSYDADKPRRHSGGLLQKPSRALPPLREVDTEGQKEVESAVSSPSASEASSDAYHETWLENVRCIEWLREAIQHRIKTGDFENDQDRETARASKDSQMTDVTPQFSPASETPKPVIDESESLYPMLKPLSL